MLTKPHISTGYGPVWYLEFPPFWTPLMMRTYREHIFTPWANQVRPGWVAWRAAAGCQQPV